MESVISFHNVSKRFMLHHQRPRSLQELLIRTLTPWQRPPKGEELWALRDVSFRVPRGKTLGLIGENGSGKSTALKIMSGILQPTEGEVVVRGRVSALLELGSGMHPELTGRENIFLNGSLLGMTNREMKALYPRIVAFAELERFIDMPVKHYSSGMYMRLGFSVAIHVQPDILLLDEVLAVGDQAFQTKCLDRIYQMKKRGTTIVIVSHGLDALRDMCDELVWLNKGVFMKQGPSHSVIRTYLRYIHEVSKKSASFTSESVDPEQRWGTGEIEITDVRLRQGEEYTGNFVTGDSFIVEIDYIAHKRISHPVFGMAIHRVDGTHINGPNTKLARLDLGIIEGRGTVHYTIPELPLMPGSYDVTVSAYDEQVVHAYDVHWRVYPFHVLAGGTSEVYGLLHVPGRWKHLSDKGATTGEAAVEQTLPTAL